ncbi:MAG: DUF1559 domain-containing protein [Verrucomicrobia bacterium]|nr:DUF1559 domain-containing protein [Verrucomicrobiota bacterium]
MRFAMQNRDLGMGGIKPSGQLGGMDSRLEKNWLSAFTLTELLVVMAILGLLAGLGIPAIKRGLDAGKTAKCANNLKQLGVGFQRFAAENSGTLPMAWFNDGYPGWPGWDVLILDYLEVGTKGSSGVRPTFSIRVRTETFATPTGSISRAKTCRVIFH